MILQFCTSEHHSADMVQDMGAGSSEILVGYLEPPSQFRPTLYSAPRAEYMNALYHPSPLASGAPLFTLDKMYSAMSRPYTTNHAHSSMGYEPYQTSEYDRAIQQAAERERAAEAARSRSSSTTTTTTTTTSHIPIPAKSSTQLPRLPGLNDLFASKLLINPDSSSRESRRSPDYDDHRRDSVARGSYFDTLRPSDLSARPRTVITPPLVHASSPYGSQPKTSPLTIQSLCSAPEHNFISPTSSLPTSPATSQSSNSSLMQPASHSQPTSPHELPPAFFGTSDLAPATYVYQAASAYEGVSYIHGRGPCHMYKGGYSSNSTYDAVLW